METESYGDNKKPPTTHTTSIHFACQLTQGMDLQRVKSSGASFQGLNTFEQLSDMLVSWYLFCSEAPTWTADYPPFVSINVY